ncbi:24178_t:CDS:10, partial [Dentiscutata erythropus]
MITDLFIIKHNEPKSIIILRRCVIIIFVGLLIAVFIVLCIGVHDELPSVNVTYKVVDSLPIPDIFFSYNYNFTINCAISNFTGNYNCNNYINKTIYDTSQSKYSTALSANYYVTSNTRCTLSINITDPRYNISNQNDYMEMYAYDKEYYLNPIITGSQTQFVESLLLKNMYFFGQPKNDIANYEWVFDRHIRHSLVQDVLSFFGRQKYITIPYLESHMATATTANSDLRTNNTYYAVLRFIMSPPFIVTDETEERSKTILNILGVIGGIWSGVVALYIFLFGPGLISPWGFVQKSRLFKNQYEKNILPFVCEPDTTEGFNNSMQKRLNNLEKR